MEEDGDTNKEKGDAVRALVYPDEDETNLEVDVGGKGTMPVIDPQMVPPPPPGYKSPREKKRSKKGSNSTASESTENIFMATEAASEEDRRAQ
jgi:hypothetical protein